MRTLPGQTAAAAESSHWQPPVGGATRATRVDNLSSKEEAHHSAAAAMHDHRLPARWRLRTRVLAAPFECCLKITAPALSTQTLPCTANAGVRAQRRAALTAGRGRLTLDILPTAPPGPWSAAICSTDGVQLGIVEIVL